MAKTLLNFAHPLSREARASLEAYEGEEIQEIMVPCYLDLSSPLPPQIREMVEAAPIPLASAHLIIPPSLGAAAYLLAANHLPQPQPLAGRPRMVWVRRGGQRFVLGGVEERG